MDETDDSNGKPTTVTVSEGTLQRLHGRKRARESLDDVIGRLLDATEGNEEGGQ